LLRENEGKNELERASDRINTEENRFKKYRPASSDPAEPTQYGQEYTVDMSPKKDDFFIVIQTKL
jgi:hypothetical protein